MTDVLIKAGRSGELFQTDPDIESVAHRELKDQEIHTMEQAGSICSDWSRIRVSEGTDLDLIRSCIFEGDVLIHLPSGGLSDSTIRRCVLNGPLSVRSCRLLHGYSLMPGCKVEYSGAVIWEDHEGFLSGMIQAGVETGERAIPLIPEMTHLDAAFLSSAQGREPALKAMELLRYQMSSARGVIGKNAIVSCCSFIRNSVLLQGSKAENSGSLRGSLLLPGAEVKDGAQLTGSVLQWNALVSSLAVVEDSIVGECSTVEKHAVLSSSFLGADSVLGEGEITASIVGPLTGMHHQSLLIAALWPGGKGNVGYGANVGSNHTSRLPDQEIRPGTGLFFGLSTAVKYPADFSKSPYSVIATGVTTLPQKIEYPFSLILSSDNPPEGTPPGWCRLVPGWMLHSNLYSVLRNQWKYSNRCRSVNTPVQTDVFSAEVLAMIKTALERLESGTAAGTGKNYITEEDRIRGMQVYRKCLRTFELSRKLSSGQMDKGEAGEFLDMLEQIIKYTLSSRMKDFRRGEEIIEDYMEVRVPPEDDPFIRVLLEKTAALEDVLRTLKG